MFSALNNMKSVASEIFNLARSNFTGSQPEQPNPIPAPAPPTPIPEQSDVRHKIASIMKANMTTPWISQNIANEQERENFLEILRSGLTGGRLADLNESEPKNLYMVFGFASQGYGNWEEIESKLEKWCDLNDKKHKETGWILMTQGDGNYGKKSIESIAQFVAARGTPVVFIQSHYGYAEPGTKYWPTYASAGLFGEGIHHDQPKLLPCGTPKKDKYENAMFKEVWGGYRKDNEGKRTGEIGFPDAAVLQDTVNGVCLKDYLGGIFIAGGGDITLEQTELYNFKNADRDGDCYVSAETVKGEASKLNKIFDDTPHQPNNQTKNQSNNQPKQPSVFQFARELKRARQIRSEL